MADPIRIPLVNGRGFALIDAADAELAGSEYARLNFPGRDG